MSTIAQRARMEADEAEQEEQGEQEEGGEVEKPAEEQETEEEQPAKPAMTEQQAEREFKKLEKLAETYLPKALAQAQLLEIPVTPCPLCQFPGLAIPRQAHEVTSDVESAVLALIGKAQRPAFIESGQYERCLDCDGWGEVLTGAQKEISQTAPCNPCGGKGFKMVTNVTPIIAPPITQPFPGASVSYTPAPGGLPDQWLRPAGHPHWGLDPAQVGG